MATAALLIAASGARAEDDMESAFRGKRLAEANCADCHAIAQYDESALSVAPPLREIGTQFSAAQLRDMLRGQVFLDHAVMPDFEPDEEQANDLANYIIGISEFRSEAHEGPDRRLPRR